MDGGQEDMRAKFPGWSHLSRDDHRETEVEVVLAADPGGRSGEANPARPIREWPIRWKKRR